MDKDESGNLAATHEPLVSAKDLEKIKLDADRYQLASEAVGGIIYDWDLTTGQIERSNRLLAIIGYAPDEVEWTLDFWLSRLHAADIEICKKKMADAMASRSQSLTIDYRVLHRDGHYIDCHESARLLYDELGVCKRVVGYTVDVSEKKKLERELDGQRKLLSNAQAMANLGCFSWNVRTHQLAWSDELFRIYGCEPGSFAPSVEKFLSFIHPEDREFVQKKIQSALADKQPFEMEERIIRLDGSNRVLESRGQVITDEHGAPIELLGVCKDVTEQRVLQQRLLAAQKMEAIGRLAGGVAHDFNNLITIINGYCDLMLDEVGENAALRESIAAIQEAGGRAARLTSQLLAFGRRAVVEPTNLDLNEVVAQSVKLFKRIIPESVILELDLQSELPAIRADRAQIEQVLTNLVVNACDAMPNGGRLGIVSRYLLESVNGIQGSKPGIVELLISDNGCGISIENQAKIFEPFFTTKKIGKGTGLGLAVVHGVVTQCGGEISVSSKPGEGTRFTLRFPPAAEKTSGNSAVLDRSIPQAKASILLVEDDAPVRKIVQLALQSAGHEVVTAEDAREALEIVEKRPGAFDLLVTDVVMPNMNGPELAKILVTSYPGLRILFMSGYTANQKLPGEDLIARNGFIQKPFVPADLLKQVDRILTVTPEI